MKLAAMALDVPELARPEMPLPDPRTRRAAHPRTVVRSPVAGIVALTALAAVTRFVGLGAQSFWLDESATVHIMRMGFGQMQQWIPHHEGTPPLYYTLAWLWTRVFGVTAFGLRSLSAVFGTLTVPVMWAAGRRLGERVGLAVAALAACSPLLIWYSQEARSYALLTLLSAVSLLAWLHLHEHPSARWSAVWGLAAMLAFATHWYCMIIIAPEALWLMRRRRDQRSVRIALAALLATVLCLLPMMHREFLVIGGGNLWTTLVPLGWRLALVPRSFAIGPDAIAAPVLLGATGLAVTTAIWLLLRRVDPPVRRATSRPAALILGGLALLAMLLLAGSDQVDYRNLISLWLPVSLIVAAGLAGPGAGRLGAAALALLCAAGLTATISVVLDVHYQRPQWSEIAATIGDAQTPPVFLVNGCSAAPLNVYLRGLEQSSPAGVMSNRLDLVSADGQRSYGVITIDDWAESCQPVAHDFVAPHRVGPFVLAGRPVHLGNQWVWRLRARHPVRVDNAALRRWGLPGDLFTRSAAPGSSASGTVPGAAVPATREGPPWGPLSSSETAVRPWPTSSPTCRACHRRRRRRHPSPEPRRRSPRW